MTRSRHVLAVVLAGLFSLAARPAASGPTPFAGELPLTTSDIQRLREQLTLDEFFDVLDFVGALRVFEDDASTPGRPVFYLAPFFTADTSQEVIGGQTIAVDLLDYLDSLDELLAVISASHLTVDRLESVRADYAALGARLTGNQSPIPPSHSPALFAYAARDNPYGRELELIPARIQEMMNKLPLDIKRAITLEILRALDHLGVPLTAAERRLAVTDPYRFVLTALVRLRAYVATLLLGVRHATFVSGMTADELRLLRLYQRLRPDVALRPLPIHVLKVVPISMTSESNALIGESISSPEMIRGVNASTGGVCGRSTSCTVLVEYTEMGARSALHSTRGAAIMPAQFVGDVLVSLDPLSSPVTCDIRALRRRLALPFGLGLLGDREVRRVLPGSGACRNSLGEANKLAATVLLAGAYRNLLFDPVQLSRPRRAELSSQIRQLLDEGESILDQLGLVGTILGPVGRPREEYLESFAQVNYNRLMPRFPDELIAGILVNAGPAVETARFDFDGIAIACWKQGEREPYLSACPLEGAEADTQIARTEDLQARSCRDTPGLLDCAAAIQGPPPDERGFLW